MRFLVWLLCIVLLALLVATRGCSGQVFSNNVEASDQTRASQLPGIPLMSNAIANLGQLANMGSMVGLGSPIIPSENLKPIGDIVNGLVKTAQAITTTTTTTTKPPIVELGHNIHNLNQRIMAGTKLADTPIKLLNGLLSSANEVSASGTKSISNGADQLSMATKINAKKFAMGLDSAEQEYIETDETGGVQPSQNPKYYSRECQFRIACEAGKLMKPFTYTLTKGIETNKFLQDLHNRYTRAFTYGSIKGDCDKYYCALFAMFNGPVGLASGLAEIANRMANPDMYEGIK